MWYSDKYGTFYVAELGEITAMGLVILKTHLNISTADSAPISINKTALIIKQISVSVA